MKTTIFSLGDGPRCAAFVLAALAADAAMAQDAQLDGQCLPRLTHQQQRLYDKANDGTDALRQFIFIRRAILQVDTHETAVWADSLNRSRTMCAKNLSDVRTSAQAAGS